MVLAVLILPPGMRVAAFEPEEKAQPVLNMNRTQGFPSSAQSLDFA